MARVLRADGVTPTEEAVSLFLGGKQAVAASDPETFKTRGKAATNWLIDQYLFFIHAPFPSITLQRASARDTPLEKISWAPHYAFFRVQESPVTNADADKRVRYNYTRQKK